MACVRNTISVSKIILLFLALMTYSVLLSLISSEIFLRRYHSNILNQSRDLKGSDNILKQLEIVPEQPSIVLVQSDVVLEQSSKVLKVRNDSDAKSSSNQNKKESMQVNSHHDNQWNGKEGNRAFYKIPGVEIYLKSAHLDDRFNETCVRMFGIQNTRIKNNQTRLYCRFTIDGATYKSYKYVPVKIVPVFPPYPYGVLFYTSSYWCDVPHLSDTDFVGIYTSRSIETNDGTFLKIENEQLKTGKVKQNMSICVKPITGTQNVLRFVEWIEFHKISGIDHFVIYTNESNNANKNEVEQILDYYQTKGLLDVQYDRFFYSILPHLKVKYELNDEKIGWIMSQVYLTSYNDCLYRYRNRFNYILMLDLDEIISSSDPNIRIIDVIESGAARLPNVGGWPFHSGWHLDTYGQVNISPHQHLHSQMYLKRSIINSDSDKTFSATAYALLVTWHVTVYCKYTQGPIRENCNMFPGMYLKPAVEQAIVVHHYRHSCRSMPKKCEEYLKGTVVDNSTLQYGDALNINVVKVFKDLDLPFP
ncbi:unnamed protein product [Owenia fusiformis]|uniref:Glycosyltransferase family 92 protein n=1 Tax=Owenia fusiformis TaxID=6347 RepID=A0A8J1UTF1_OWEFU|nr:unnamed protein product [Owenia fusiformis]